MRALVALIRRGLYLEFRQREALVTLLFLSIITAVIVAFGVRNSMLEPQAVSKLLPALIWMIFILACGVALGRTSEYDLHHHALEGLIVTGVAPTLLFTARVVSNSLIACCGQLMNLIALMVLLDLPDQGLFHTIFCVSPLVVLGYASLATLLSGITSSSPMRGLLLPLLLLPLLLPLFFSAVELTREVMMSGSLDPASVWLSLLVGLDVVYFVLGFNLYEYVIRE